MNNRNLRLVYVSLIGKDEDVYEYDFYFSHDPDSFWGLGFDCEFAAQDFPEPDPKTYSETRRLRTFIPFFLAQNNRCFSMQHVVDGVISVAFEDITGYDEYPEPYRLVFQFGEDIESVEDKLAGRKSFFED